MGIIQIKKVEKKVVNGKVGENRQKVEGSENQGGGSTGGNAHKGSDPMCYEKFPK